MNLSKEEIQKIVLGVLLLAALTYVYFSLLLGPLVRSRDAMTKAMEQLQPKTLEAKAQINRIEAMAASVPKAQAEIDRIKSLIPDSSPIAWFPTRMTDFFKNQGIEKAATRIEKDGPEEQTLGGLRRATWSVEIPKVDFMVFAAALARMENEEPLSEIVDLQIGVERDSVEYPRASMSLQNIVKK